MSKQRSTRKHILCRIGLHRWASYVYTELSTIEWEGMAYVDEHLRGVKWPSVPKGETVLVPREDGHICARCRKRREL